MCDANLYALTWNDEDFPYNKKSLANLVNDFMLEENCTQIVNTHTRSELVNGIVQRACLDHIMTNVPSKCTTPLVVTEGNSDHMAVFVTKYTEKYQIVSKNLQTFQ